MHLCGLGPDQQGNCAAALNQQRITQQTVRVQLPSSGTLLKHVQFAPSLAPCQNFFSVAPALAPCPRSGTSFKCVQFAPALMPYQSMHCLPLL